MGKRKKPLAQLVSNRTGLGTSLVETAQAIQIFPATADRWSDFEKLMGTKGGCGGCWCMLWRLDSKAYATSKGDGNKQAIKQLIESDNSPGLLAYLEGQPVGWCAVARRADYIKLEKSWVLRPIDDEPVWSISCFFILKAYRKKGLSVALLNAVYDFVKLRGGTILEGYPIAPTKKPYPAVYAWTGLMNAFLKAGFIEMDRRSETRPIMRKTIS